ncbi:flavodoxin domain-containing protein, partial [Enterococcus faecalis]|uniref:flavodoxin domain-containing protein n=1 Tax=Enterococcus faecalis TaxID=1351 RepID=UPI003D6AB3FB
DLPGKPFGVVGSGDREYGESVCKTAHDFVGALEKAGAKKVAETVENENKAEEEDIEMLKIFVKSVATTLSDSVA